MRLVSSLFSRRWWWVTLLVVALMALLARLGVWQLDRLEQRRAANAVLAASLEAPPFDLNHTPLPADIASWENRQVFAGGAFDREREMLLKVQNWQGRAGVHLITPLVFEDGATAVLIDRGWVPDAQSGSEARAAFEEPGEVSLKGYIALSQELKQAPAATPASPQVEWYRVDIPAIQPQLPYRLLPFYVVQAPDNNDQLPYRQERQIDLSEGPHLGYAIQWFTFSLGLGIAYLIFVNRNSSQGG